VSTVHAAGTGTVTIRLAGPFVAQPAGGGAEVPGIGSRKARTLLKLLAVERARPVPVDRIIDALWGDTPPLARWLGSPEGEAVIQVVRGVLLPYPTNQTVSVLVEAIQIAARQRTKKRVALTALGGLALAGLIYLGSQG